MCIKLRKILYVKKNTIFIELYSYLTAKNITKYVFLIDFYTCTFLHLKLLNFLTTNQFFSFNRLKNIYILNYQPRN